MGDKKKENIPVAFSGQKRLFVKRVGTGEKGGNPKELMKYSALRVKKLQQTKGARPTAQMMEKQLEQREAERGNTLQVEAPL